MLKRRRVSSVIVVAVLIFLQNFCALCPCKTTKVFVLPHFVDKVADGAFDNTIYLQKIVLVKDIDTQTFEHKEIAKEIK